MRSAGDYALMHANGVPFAEIVNLIRLETLAEAGRATFEESLPPGGYGSVCECTTCQEVDGE